MTETVLVETDARGVARVTLNRPEVHNAFDDALVGKLTETMRRLDGDPAIRVVVLTGAGKSFCAGADLSWMKRMAGYGEAENVADAMGLATLMRTIDELGKPVVSLVHGPAFAGGVGLVATSDIAVASEAAVFSLSEARLGLIVSTIGPYVVAAIGPHQARRYFLTAERFSAEEALRIGLVHDVVAPERLAAAGEAFVTQLLECGPEALRESKRLIADVAFHPITDALTALTARRIAERRASSEAKEGIAAFFEKRKPSWRK
jgi:methylglutaconyl-CoA hydratase